MCGHALTSGAQEHAGKAPNGSPPPPERRSAALSVVEGAYLGGPPWTTLQTSHTPSASGAAGMVMRAKLQRQGGVGTPAPLAPLPTAFAAPRRTSAERPCTPPLHPAHQPRPLTRTRTGRYGSGQPAVDAARGMSRPAVHLRRSTRLLHIGESRRAAACIAWPPTIEHSRDCGGGAPGRCCGRGRVA